MGLLMTYTMFIIVSLNDLAKKKSIFSHFKKMAKTKIFNTVFYSLAFAGTLWVSVKIIRIIVA